MGVIMGNRLVGMVFMVVGMGMAVGHIAMAVFMGMDDDFALPAAFAAIVRLDLSGAAAFGAFLGCIGHDLSPFGWIGFQYRSRLHYVHHRPFPIPGK
jgi:hypothetical protein